MTFENLSIFFYLWSVIMRTILISILAIFLLQGCFQLIAIRTVGGMLDYGFETFNEESDLKLAEGALGSNLKLVETFLKGDPENEKLLLIAAQGYGAYSLAFVEDEDPERARQFYLRGKDYGLQILGKNAGFRATISGGLSTFQKSLDGFKQKDVPAIFWTAFAWGGVINMNRADISAIAELPKVKAMMDFVLKYDENFYYGGAHLFFGMIEGSMPAMLGGKPEIAKMHFEKCLKINEGKFLLAKVYFAMTYAVQIQNKDLFLSLLNEVVDAPIEILPGAKLPNAVAKRKANDLLARVDELF